MSVKEPKNLAEATDPKTHKAKPDAPKEFVDESGRTLRKNEQGKYDIVFQEGIPNSEQV